MDNEKKYKNIFIDIFETDESILNSMFTVNMINNWDSIRQMSLVAALEDELDIMLDSNDILDFDSYEKGKQILRKYGIEI